MNAGIDAELPPLPPAPALPALPDWDCSPPWLWPACAPCPPAPSTAPFVFPDALAVAPPAARPALPLLLGPPAVVAAPSGVCELHASVPTSGTALSAHSRRNETACFTSNG